MHWALFAGSLALAYATNWAWWAVVILLIIVFDCWSMPGKAPKTSDELLKEWEDEQRKDW